MRPSYHNLEPTGAPYSHPDLIVTEPDFDGYLLRTTCLLDGLPGRITIRVDNDRPKRSEASLTVFDVTAHYTWRAVLNWDADQIERDRFVGVLIDDSDRDRMAREFWRVAHSMWLMGSDIIGIAHRRTMELSAQTEVARLSAVRAQQIKWDLLDAVAEDSERAYRGEVDAAQYVTHNAENDPRTGVIDDPERAPEDGEDLEPYTGTTEEEQG